MPNLGNRGQTDNNKIRNDCALLDAFLELCAARASRYASGELNGIAAVDFLQDWAFTRGLVDEIGQDAVQAIMTQAFLPYRGDLS
jgi:hypothetical protein